MKLYTELAEWWHLMSHPDDYAEEARLYWQIIQKHKSDVHTALELGSGGGNNASHLKQHCQWTLTDLAPGMLDVSRKLNPECEHVQGDMRDLDLGKTFDLVFIHDAIMYMTSETDLLRVFHTAEKHLGDDGLLFIAPDFFKETFRPSTDHGGEDAADRSFRYLEWTYDRDPDDNVVETEYVYLLRTEDTSPLFRREEPGVSSTKTVCVHDSATVGLFSKDTWARLLGEAGFEVMFEDILHSEFEAGRYVGIVGQRA